MEDLSEMIKLDSQPCGGGVRRPRGVDPVRRRCQPATPAADGFLVRDVLGEDPGFARLVFQTSQGAALLETIVLAQLTTQMLALGRSARPRPDPSVGTNLAGKGPEDSGHSNTTCTPAN